MDPHSKLALDVWTPSSHIHVLKGYRKISSRLRLSREEYSGLRKDRKKVRILFACLLLVALGLHRAGNLSARELLFSSGLDSGELESGPEAKGPVHCLAPHWCQERLPWLTY